MKSLMQKQDFSAFLPQPPQTQTVCVCVSGEGGEKRKVFLIVCQVRGSGSSITHDRVRVVFREFLAGYLSRLSIHLLGPGLCVGMIRSWRLGRKLRYRWGERGGD